MAKGSKLAAKSTKLKGLLKNLGSEKIDGFFEKRPEVLKTAKLSRFDFDCNRNS